MTHERIALNGVPVIGFGDEASEKKFYGTMIGLPLLGAIAGTVGGAMLGKSFAEHTVGAIVGGVGGAIFGLGAGVLWLGAADKDQK